MAISRVSVCSILSLIVFSVSTLSAQSLEQAIASGKLYKSLSDSGKTLVAIKHVNVIPMKGRHLMPHQTVIIENGFIIAIGYVNQVKIPRRAVIIYGKGLYLLPGLVDFHVHFPKDSIDFPITLQLFLSNGITTIVNMNGSAELLQLRQKIYDGTIAGPTMFSTGPFMNRPIVKTADEVENAVIDEKKMGYDFIKVHGELSAEQYGRLFKVAEKEKIRVDDDIVFLFNVYDYFF